MKILDYTLEYTSCYNHAAQKFSFVCKKNKNPTLEELLFYYVRERSVEELKFFLNNCTPNINYVNIDDDTAIMTANMYFSLSKNMDEMLNAYEKIKLLNQQNINYKLINIDGQNIVNDLLMSSFTSTENPVFDTVKQQKKLELIDLFLSSGAPLDYEITRFASNAFDMPAFLAKNDKYNWALEFLIQKGLDVNCIYRDEDGDNNTLIEFAKEQNSQKNVALIFEHITENLEKKSLDNMITQPNNNQKMKTKL